MFTTQNYRSGRMWLWSNARMVSTTLQLAKKLKSIPWRCNAKDRTVAKHLNQIAWLVLLIWFPRYLVTISINHLFLTINRYMLDFFNVTAGFLFFNSLEFFILHRIYLIHMTSYFSIFFLFPWQIINESASFSVFEKDKWLACCYFL